MKGRLLLDYYARNRQSGHTTTLLRGVNGIAKDGALGGNPVILVAHNKSMAKHLECQVHGGVRVVNMHSDELMGLHGPLVADHVVWEMLLGDAYARVDDLEKQNGVLLDKLRKVQEITFNLRPEGI